MILNFRDVKTFTGINGCYRYSSFEMTDSRYPPIILTLFFCRQCVHIKGVKLLQCELVLLDIETVVRESETGMISAGFLFLFPHIRRHIWTYMCANIVSYEV